MNRTRIVLAIASALGWGQLQAQAPVDMTNYIDVMADAGRAKLELGLTYTNSERRDVLTGAPLEVQTGPTSFISLPTLINEAEGSSDVIVASLGLRYGITADLEIYGRLHALYAQHRSQDLHHQVQRQEDSGLSDAWVGLNYRLSPDTTTPALLGFVEAAVYERHDQRSASLKSWMGGLTTYRAIDPIILSLTAALRWNQERKLDNYRLNPGDFVMLTPSAAFAVNDRITLTSGWQWTSRASDRHDGLATHFRRNHSDLLLGIGYGVAKGNSLLLNFKTDASGHRGAELRLNWTQRF